LKFSLKKTFQTIDLNNKQFANLSTAQVPTYFTLEKPARFLPLLSVGAKAPKLELSYSENRIFL
jgi:hypothetical protein